MNRNKSLLFISGAWILFHIYMAISPWPAMMARPVHLSFSLMVAFCACPLFKKEGGKEQAGVYIDSLLVILSAGVGAFYLANYDRFMNRMLFVTDMTLIDITIGVLFLLLTFDACRRIIGWSLTTVGLVFAAYAFIGSWMPGLLAHRGLPFTRFIELQAISENGLLGMAIQTSCDYIFYFILLAGLMEATGTIELFIGVALRLTGRLVGGPAKVAVIASSLMGMVNGSAAANVVGTGVMTIPLMKRYGFRPEFAGAVEAAASTGGQILPPVMGIGAFIMAEYLGVSYWSIAKAAFIPAVGYYIAVYVMVHMQSLKMNLAGVIIEDLPKINVAARLHLIIPLLMLVYFLATGYSLRTTAFYSFVALTVLSFLNKETRLRPDTTKEAVISIGKNAALIAVACGVSGVITGVVVQTGLALRFSSLILEIAGGNLFFVLFFTMIATLVMGMGVPTVAAYMIGAIIFVPALVQLNIPPLAAHLFVFYYGVLGMITPPVCLASYAAASLAQADFMKTGWAAVMLTLPGFIIPYAFVSNPALLLAGPVPEILRTSITLSVGVIVMGCALVGYYKGDLSWLERVILFIVSLMLISPEFYTDIIGAVSVVLFLIWRWHCNRKTGNPSPPGRMRQEKI
jgi:TRAP transporter 4TM/12TM fusion protein